MAVFKTNDNVEIYYEVRGEGRPLFLLPVCIMNRQRKR